MAKKKPSANSATKKAKKPAAPKSSKKKPAPKSPPLTDHVIGATAGEVWALLSDNGELTLAAIKKGCGASPEASLMALGWLAREGKLRFETKGRSVKVALC